MLCKNPFVPATGPAFGCGQCMPCRYNRRRIWKHRILLEAVKHEDKSFVTLTYSDYHLPADNSLAPRDLQLWIKRLRKAMEPRLLRYFAVGEYGDESQRPHYHAALFGYPRCAYGQSRYSKRVIDCCYWCDLIRDTWGKGHVYLGTVEPDSAQYLAGYVTKKMTAKDDERLKGRHPEYARMSLKPGIGADAMLDVASVMLFYGMDDAADVPLALAHGRKELPLGRYLRRKLREAVGRDGKIPQAAMDELCAQMQAVRLAARSSTEDPSVLSHLMKEMGQRALNFEGRQKIFATRRAKL